MKAMGAAYEAVLLPDRHALLFQMQGYATGEPEIRDHVREGYGELVRLVARWRACRSEETWDFFAYGMLLNVDGRARRRASRRAGGVVQGE